MEQSLKRLHPFILAFDLYKLIKGNIIFFVFIFLLNMGSDKWWIQTAKWLFLAYVVIMLFVNIGKWLTYRYEIKDNAIYIKSGIFLKSEQTVPFLKVQNVQRQTTVFHKIFKVTSLTLETAAVGEESSITFDVISRAEAESLERVVTVTYEQQVINELTEAELFEEQLVEQEPKSEKTTHFTPTKRDLVKASFTSLSFLILIPIIFKLDDIVKFDTFADEVTDALKWGWAILAIVIIGVLLISIAIGMIHTFIKYGKYEISSDTQKVYIKKGVLDESIFSIRKEKVQAVEISQSLMKRLLGLAEVKLISAGNTTIGEVETNTLYPFLPVHRAYELISELLPDYQVEESMHKLPGNAFWIRMIRPSYIWLIATAAIWYFKPSLWWISLALLLVIYVSRILDFKNSRYLLNESFIQMKEGGFSTTLFITKRSQVIEVKAERSKLQRYFNVASIETVNRAKPVHHNKLIDVPHEVANEFYRWYMDRKHEIKTQ
ncbi:PH domain-containing protein [Viridibacillus sp. YIM B01967]|uniref:PH domain-containing protein n=1 Tax=Viridibacillus soli TaxID=2798301 RepID=A0ABS1H5U6_9BACL|nr:PH domain-containing protein [Viridibacillus soli]MBK3494661.1 PH domain-containing protein [Viridibacillus soli]